VSRTRSALRGGRSLACDRSAGKAVRARDEAGLTLIEVIVSLLILGVILTASAASLITFTQTARENERRVQATALLGRAHEEFQARPWETLGTLADDLTDPDDLTQPEHLGTALVVNEAVNEYLFTGDDGVQREIVITESADDALPAYSGVFEADDGRDYELYQIVTWVDRTGDGNPDLKRLTAVVRWQVGARAFEQTFVSDRAPSVQEAGDVAFPRLIQYDLFPIQQELEPNLCWYATTALAAIQVAVRFSDGVTDVRLEFYSVDLAESLATGTVVLQEETVDFGPAIIDNPAGDGGVYFVAEIPAGAYVFPPGERPVRVVAETVLDGEVFTAGSRNLRFALPDVLPSDSCTPESAPWPATPDPDADDDDDGDDPPDLGDPVVVGPLTVSPATPVQLINDQGSRLTCVPVQVQFSIDSGLEPTDTVQLNYFTGQQGNTPQNRTVTEAEVAIGTVVFPAGVDHSWRNNTSTAFSLLVLRDGNVVGASVSSPTVSFTNANNC
jgi:prepilin-type N-terminal cleavage/methylation domain-containing protein